MTSCVAQDIIGFKPLPDGGDAVINHAAENVSSWNDIHAASGSDRLAFVSDLPGSARFIKSALRAVTGWAPHFVFLCVPAYAAGRPPSPGEAVCDLDLCLWHLRLLRRLRIPTIVVITKVDSTAKHILKQTLFCLLSAIKQTDRKPILLAPEPSQTQPDLQKLNLETKSAVSSTVDALREDPLTSVPVLLTSSTTGLGIQRVLALLRLLPCGIGNQRSIASVTSTTATAQGMLHARQSVRPTDELGSNYSGPSSAFDILDVFKVPSLQVSAPPSDDNLDGQQSVVVCGRARHGTLHIGQIYACGPVSVETRHTGTEHARSSPPCDRQVAWIRVRVTSARNLRLPVDSLHAGDIGTLGIEPLVSSPLFSRLRKGMVLLPQSALTHPQSLPASLNFQATFDAQDALRTIEPVLAQGLTVMVYINNVRATARVTRLDLYTSQPATSRADVPLTTMSGNDGTGLLRHISSVAVEHHQSTKNVAVISLTFLAAAEWVEPGSPVLIMSANPKSSAAEGEITHTRTPPIVVATACGQSTVDCCR
ncbi:hypothetical protein KEM52_002962 [Ascosphaera acerosa]|nr:hypothetical protein KEM52_002962 [Ascosphaera acerosa]